MTERSEKKSEVRARLESIVGWLLCFLGWHRWTWRYEVGTLLCLDVSPPDHAKCSRCGVSYRTPNAGIDVPERSGGNVR